MPFPTWKPNLSHNELVELLAFYDYITEESRIIVATYDRTLFTRVYHDVDHDFYAYPDKYPSELPCYLDIPGWTKFHEKVERICQQPKTHDLKK